LKRSKITCRVEQCLRQRYTRHALASLFGFRRVTGTDSEALSTEGRRETVAALDSIQA